MKKKLPATGTLAAVALSLGLAVASWAARALPAEEETASATSVFAVQGMTCGGCEAGVEVKVGKLDGVERVEASYREGTAEVTYDPGRVTPEAIVGAIEELGYTAELIEQEGEGTAAKSSLLSRLLACC